MIYTSAEVQRVINRHEEDLAGQNHNPCVSYATFEDYTTFYYEDGSENRVMWDKSKFVWDNKPY